MSLRSEIVKVTPALAYRWLECNTHNRPVSDKTVKVYAQDMTDGKWVLTHQGIAFDTKGTLCDGQHRLFAVIESGCTIEMLVTHGVDPSALGNIDGQRIRSIADNLGLVYGVSAAKLITSRCAAIRVLEAYPETSHTGFSNKSSIAQVRDLFARYAEGLTWSTAVMPARFNVGQAPVAGALAYCYRTNPAKVEAFAIQVRDGENLTKSDPAYALRTFLEAQATSGTNVVRYTNLLATIRALYAYMNGEKLTVLKAATFLDPTATKRDSTIDAAMKFFAKVYRSPKKAA